MRAGAFHRLPLRAHTTARLVSPQQEARFRHLIQGKAALATLAHGYVLSNRRIAMFYPLRNQNLATMPFELHLVSKAGVSPFLCGAHRCEFCHLGLPQLIRLSQTGQWRTEGSKQLTGIYTTEAIRSEFLQTSSSKGFYHLKKAGISLV